MNKPEQMVFELPDLPERIVETPPEPPAREKPARTGKRAKQLSLDVRFYLVRSGFGECTVQARSPSAAKYIAFKAAKESGLYCYDGGFLAFVGGGVKVSELRQ